MLVVCDFFIMPLILSRPIIVSHKTELSSDKNKYIAFLETLIDRKLVANW